MADGEVSLRLAGLGGLGLDEASRFTQVVVVQLVREGLVSGFREHRLFLEDGHDTHGLFFMSQIEKKTRKSRLVMTLNYSSSDNCRLMIGNVVKDTYLVVCI